MHNENSALLALIIGCTNSEQKRTTVRNTAYELFDLD